MNDIEGAFFNPSVDGSSTPVDLSAYAAIAGNDSDLGTMVAAILTAVTAVPSSQPLLRAQTAAYLIVSSSQYQIQR